MIFEKIRTRLEKLIYDKSYLFNREDRNEDKYFFQLMCLKGEIMPLINQVEAEYNNGWIPCSERLPEDMQKCLVTARIYFTPDHVDETDNYIGVDFNTYSSRFGWLGGNEVIAWQPLPEPYKKGE